MKRIVCLLLVLVFASTMITSAFADTYVETVENSAELPKEYESYSVSEYDGIYENNESDYVLKFASTSGVASYIPVEKIELKANETENINNFLTREDIPKEIRDDIRKVYNEQQLLGTTDFRVDLFAPISTNSSSGPDKLYGTDSYGRQMMGYKYFYYNLSTGWKDVKRGTGTKNAASALKSVILTTAGMANKYISYAQSGISLLNAFYNYYGLNNVTAATSDYLQARLVWDHTKQYTYAYDGAWHLGLVTSYVIVRKIGVEEYFYKSGKAPYTSDRTVNVHLYSKHYYDQWDYAAAYMYNHVEEPIKWKTNGITFYFS